MQPLNLVRHGYLLSAILCVAAPAAFLTSAQAQAASGRQGTAAIDEFGVSGSIGGVIRNAATGDPLVNASITVPGTFAQVLSGSDGRYALPLRAGRHTIAVSFTGLDSAQATVEVASGRTTELNFELTSDVYKLNAFVVRTVREDDAISLQQQRYSANPKTVVATQAYGAPADNPGELLQRIPGLSLSFAQGEAAQLSVRGMGMEFAKITVDGESVATSWGNLSSPTRGLNISEFSTNNLSQIELIKAPTPDQDADSIAGTVNLVTRRSYDKSPGAQVNATLSGLWRDFDTGPNESKLGRFGRTSFSYNDAFSIFDGQRNLGAALDVAWSRVLRTNENTGPQQAGTLDVAYVNPASADPLNRNFSTSEWGGPVEKFNASLNLDYKLGDQGFAFVRFAHTKQDRHIDRFLVRTLNTPATAAGFLPGSRFENSTVPATPAIRLDVRSLSTVRRATQQIFNVGGERKFFDRTATLALLGSYSHAVSDNPHFITATAEIAGIGYQIDRRNTELYTPAFSQVGGPSWSDPANYRITSLTNLVAAGAPSDSYAFKADLTKELGAKWRTKVKGGASYREQLTSDKRVPDSWTYVGADGVPNSSDDVMGGLAREVFRMGKQGYGPFPFLPLVTNKEQIAPASAWKKTAAQAYGDVTGAHARGTNIEERFGAAYVMGTIDCGKIRTIFGVRAERTEFETDTWTRNATATWGGNNIGGASTDPAVVAANIARAERSYVGRLKTKTKYTEVFPGAHLIWEPRDGLILRSSYNRSISRPGTLATLPMGNVNDETMRITVGNPDLKPYLSDNFEISIERYVEPVGLLSAGVFRKDISRYFRSFTDVVGSEGIDGSGLYAGYERTMSRNIGSAKIQGIELNFQQQFRRLPGLLSGLGVFANFTYVKAEGDFGAQAVTSRIPNLSPRVANVGLSYVGHGWQVRPLLNWRDKTYQGTSGSTDYDSTARTRVDLKAQYSLGKRYSVELSVFNLTNEPDDQFISSDGRLPFAQLKSGVAYSLGITGRY